MISLVKAVKVHVNYVHLVPTAQPVVETVLTYASNAHLEHTMIKLVSFDYDSIILFLIALVHATPVTIQLFTKYLVVLVFKIFNQAKQNAILVILVHSKSLLTRPLVMYVLEEHMQTSLDSKSVFNALIVLVVQMEAVYVPFVLITSTSMIDLQLAHQSFRIHPNIA
jgi:hypothetical protein